MFRRLLPFAVLAASAAIAGDVPKTPLDPVTLTGIPGQLRWNNAPVSWKSGADGLAITAGGNTDWFISPLDRKAVSSAPMLLFEPAADFTLSARVRIDFQKQWDAGCLMVYSSQRTWAKLAFEMSAYNEPTVVSVVTRGVSDDVNSATVSGNSTYFQVARTGQALFFYASADGRVWKLVRSFTLGTADHLRAGFAAQSPIGNGATAAFSDIRYTPRKIADIFKGE